jgi:hypothetical protein
MLRRRGQGLITTCYAAEHVRGGGMWPEGWVMEDEKGKDRRVTWDAMLHRNLAEAPREIEA